MMTRESILTANDCPLEPVEVPEWGGTVYVPSLSLAEGTELQKFLKAKGDDSANGAAAVWMIRDAKGDRIFQDGDAEALERKSGVVLRRIAERFNEINGLTDAKVQAAAKNSEAAQSGDSDSA